MVRWKAVREALREPSAAGLICAAADDDEGAPFGEEEEGWLERLARSLRIEVLCLRAPLKVVFCGLALALASERQVSWGRGAYHDGAVDAMRSWEKGKWEKPRRQLVVKC